MKVFTSALLLFTFPFLNFAQSPLDSSNHNLINSSKMVFVCSEGTPSYDSINGNNSTWDYSQTVGTGSKRKFSFLHPDSTTYGGEYTNYANYAMEIDGFITTYSSSNSSKIEEYGYVLPNTDLGDIKAKFFTNSWTQMQYPYSFNGTYSDMYSGNIAFVLNGNAQNPSCYGNGYTFYDGHGKLIQANGDTLTNVSRIKYLDTTYTQVPIFGQVRLIREQYQYYNMDSVGGMPVFLYAHAYVLSSLPNPLVNLYIILSDAEPTQTAGLAEMETVKQPLIYPNPSTGVVYLQNLTSTNSYRVFTSEGKFVQEGTGKSSVELTLDNGVYFIQIDGNEHPYTEKIIVRK